MVLKVKMIETPESSNIDAIGYVKQSMQLFIRFNSSKVYMYERVPVTLYSDLRAAKSKGTFFNSHIKPLYGCFDLTGSHDVVFIDENNETYTPPRMILGAQHDSRWSW